MIIVIPIMPKQKTAHFPSPSIPPPLSLIPCPLLIPFLIFRLLSGSYNSHLHQYFLISKQINIPMSACPKTIEYSPYIIAHRGYCSLFPENTLESIQAAIHKCHLVEFDILLTKDNELVIFHDRYLSELTNVAELKEFAGRKAVFVDDFSKQEEREDWWVKDFTLEELKRLKITQKSSKRPQLRRLNLGIPTLAEAIQQVLYVKQQHLKENDSGFLIQIKGQQECKDNDPRDVLIVEKLVECLQRFGLGKKEQCQARKFPIMLQSFSHQILRQLSSSSLELPIVHLYDDPTQITCEFLDSQLLPTSMGIAISEKHATKDVINVCKMKSLSVFFWTMKDDEPHLLPPQLPSIKEAYYYLFSLGVHGIITEFPQKCQQYLNTFNSYQRATHNQ